MDKNDVCSVSWLHSGFWQQQGEFSSILLRNCPQIEVLNIISHDPSTIPSLHLAKYRSRENKMHQDKVGYYLIGGYFLSLYSKCEKECK